MRVAPDQWTFFENHLRQPPAAGLEGVNPSAAPRAELVVPRRVGHSFWGRVKTTLGLVAPVVRVMPVEEFLELGLMPEGMRIPAGVSRVYLVPPGGGISVRFYAHDTLLSALQELTAGQLSDLPEGVQVEVTRIPLRADLLEAPGAVLKDWLLELPFQQDLLPVVELALGGGMPSLTELVLYALRGEGGQVVAVIGEMIFEDASGQAVHAYFV